MSESPTPDIKSIEDQQKARLMRLATYASLSVASILIISKFAAWVMTDSISILSTLVDSILDAAASLINLLAVRHALQPADQEHRFGHGKAEPLAALAQAAFICGSAAFVLIQAGERLYSPQPIQNTNTGYLVMVFSVILTVALVIFQRYVIKRSGSVAISADSLHYQTDVLINLSVIVSLFLVSQFGWVLADPVFALLIVGYIVFGAISIGKDALNILMDRELPEDDRQNIVDLVLSEPGVTGLHDLRTRSSGLQTFIQLHLEMNGEITLHQAHIISDRVEDKLAAAYPNAEVIIHEDPEGIIENHPEFK